MEAKRNADEALRLATEANNKVNELEKRLSFSEKPADDKAIMEAKRNADEALRLATEANNKVNELEKRLSFSEKPADGKAIMEAKRNADEALRLATEANNKVNELEKRLSSSEKPADDKAIMEAKRNADEALRLATEANNKVGYLENRVSSLEKTADDHEKRIRDLEGRKPEAPPPKTKGVGPYKWQLEEIGVVYFDFNKFDIKESEAKKLDELVGKITESGREVLVVGFADKRGTSNHNFNLSMWRAQMTASYLATKGVDIGKIRVAAYGKEVADMLGQDFKTQRAVKIYIIY
jgi:Outer membrane protein and related peptidoglycan-associated (lipo)proteins